MRTQSGLGYQVPKPPSILRRMVCATWSRGEEIATAFEEPFLLLTTYTFLSHVDGSK